MSVYVYGIADGREDLQLVDCAGVGDPPLTVRALTVDGLAAVVSDSPKNLRAKRRDVSAHQQVLEELARRTAVLPMRFGVIAESEQAIADALREHGAAYRQALEELRGMVEFNVKVAEDEDSALREIASHNSEIRRLNEITRSGSGTRQDSIELGELVATELRARQQKAGERIARILAAESQQAVVGERSNDAFLNASFLIAAERSDEFADSTRELAREYGASYTFRVSGPLPPYSFV
jgi:alkanesulfonate monooxygenase SsuD/methylene tetrahydromethanopterin reductase-like flavin-dependent oxidoreductase (luciferase family)